MCLPCLFPCISDPIKAIAFRPSSEEKQMLGMGVLQHRVVLYLFLLLPLGTDVVSSRREALQPIHGAQNYLGAPSQHNAIS